MTPGRHNFTIYRGVAFGPKVFVFKDSTGAVIDLSGLTARAQARENVNGAVKVDLEPEVTDAAAGEVTMEFTLAEVTAMPAGKFQWDMVFEQGDGERIGPFVFGELKIPVLNTQPQ